MTNYLYMMQMAGLRRQGTRLINTHVEEWIGPGLFLAFDRYSLDRTATVSLTRTDLHSMVRADELYKLMGTTQAYLDSIFPLIAGEYLDLGGVDRVSSPAVLGSSGAAILSSPAVSPKPPGGAPLSTWSDEDAQDVAMVLRRLQEMRAQIRNAQHVRELKALYQNGCAFCGKQTVIGVDPLKYYSEAAHIKPVGQPHNGPDRKDNMVILCPEHHLQFDRGVLRMQRRASGLRIFSKIAGDSLDGAAVRIRTPHAFNDDFVSWHYNFWTS